MLKPTNTPDPFHPSRRDFLKTSALAMAAVALGKVPVMPAAEGITVTMVTAAQKAFLAIRNRDELWSAMPPCSVESILRDVFYRERYTDSFVDNMKYAVESSYEEIYHYLEMERTGELNSYATHLSTLLNVSNPCAIRCANFIETQEAELETSAEFKSLTPKEQSDRRNKIYLDAKEHLSREMKDAGITNPFLQTELYGLRSTEAHTPETILHVLKDRMSILLNNLQGIRNVLGDEFVDEIHGQIKQGCSKNEIEQMRRMENDQVETQSHTATLFESVFATQLEPRDAVEKPRSEVTADEVVIGVAMPPRNTAILP